MLATLRRIGHDIRRRRYLDAYVVAALALMFAVLTVVGDMVPEQLRWAALLAGVGLLVYRVTVPDASTERADDLLHDRTAFDERPLSDLLRNAREVWVFGPSAVNVLSAHNCYLLRQGVLSRPEGSVRVVVLDPDDENAARLATRQLDDGLDYPIQEFRSCLQTTVRQLTTMAGWQMEGHFEHRLLDYNPGFSLVAVDPRASHGLVIVEFHAFHNETTSSRMHLELTRQLSERWYHYWIDQFDWIWREARPVASAGTTDLTDPLPPSVLRRGKIGRERAP